MIVLPAAYAGDGGLLEAAGAEANPGADDALLAALLALHGPDPASGVAQLGGLADERAVPVLGHVLFKGETPELRVAAVRALGHYPVAAPVLLDVLGQAAHGDTVRAACVEALATLQVPGVVEAIVAAREGASAELRARLDAVITTYYPEAAARLAPTRSVGGATTGYFLARSRPIDAGDAAFITGNVIVGTALGTTAALAANGSGDATWGAGLAGEAIGLGVGLGLYRRHPGRPGDGAEAITGAVVG